MRQRPVGWRSNALFDNSLKASFLRQVSHSTLGTRSVTMDDLRIRDRRRRIVPLVPNPTQAKYLSMLGEGFVGNREIILKSRQLGLSTLILALIFLDTVNTPNTYSAVIAHDTESTIRLFQMVQRFYENLPEEKRPKTEHANRREYTWPELGSTFFVGTAGARSFGRGSTINNLHCSEVAFWPDGETLMTGLLEAVPADGNVFIESTANGLGNYFHAEWEAAESGQSAFEPRFFAWHDDPEYVTEVPDGFEMTDDEAALASTYGLSAEQIAWRREKTLVLKDKFPQEYPSDPAEAFIVTGSPYFDRLALAQALTECPAPDPVAAMEYVPVRFSRLRRELAAGNLTIYASPGRDEKYVIGADTAEGLTRHNHHDFDSADVLSASDWEQVAHLHGLWDTHEFGLILAELGEYYNMALIAVERNNHGHAVINALLHSANYPKQTARTASGVYYHEEYDERKRPKARRPGWPTTIKTKAFALDGLATSVVNGDIVINHRPTISEMMRFVKLPGGGAAGEGSSHDDRVMSLAIADAVLKVKPKEVQLQRNDALYRAFWRIDEEEGF